MTSGDNNHVDAQLEALLQAMPQPRPSAELDAAILADAEAALAKNPVAVRAAANDAVAPESAHARRPSFLTRWKVPLAFAATVFLAVQIVGLQWFAAPVYDAPQTEAAAPAPAAPRPEAPPAAASEINRDAAAAKPAEQARLKAPEPKAAPARKDVRARAAPAQAGADAAVAAEPKPADSAGVPAALAKKSDAAPLRAEAAPASASATTTFSVAADRVAPAAAAPALAAGQPMAAAAPAPRATAPAGVGESPPEPAKPATQTARSVLAERSAAGATSTGVKGLSAGEFRDKAAPQAPAAASIAGAKTAAVSNEARVQADAQQPAGGYTGGAAAAADSAPIAARALKEPGDRLAQIDKLITDGKRKEALEEWARFRKQYPNHKVAPELLKRIEALKDVKE